MKRIVEGPLSGPHINLPPCRGRHFPFDDQIFQKDFLKSPAALKGLWKRLQAVAEQYQKEHLWARRRPALRSPVMAGS